MRNISKIFAIAAAVTAFAGGAAYAQDVQTPGEALETGFDDNSAVLNLPAAVGGTMASPAGGALRIAGDSGTGLVMTPDSDDHPSDE